jgi:phage-related protein
MSEIGEVSIKVNLDDSGINAQISALKTQLNSIGKSINKISTKNLGTGLGSINNNLKKMNNLTNQTTTSIKNTVSEYGKMSSQITRTMKQTMTLADGSKVITQNIQKTGNGMNGANSSLNQALANSMKILRITTTITAVYAIIKTAVNLWKTAVKGVFEVYKDVAGVITNVTLKTSEFVYKMSGTKAIVDGLGAVFGNIAEKVKEAFSVENIENFAKEANGLASDLIEVQNIIDRISKSSADGVDKWAKSLSGIFGLNELSAKKYEGTLSAVFNTSGFDESTYTKMSENLTQLTADLASLYNMDYDTVFNKIQSGIAGQTKAMMALGISVHKATLEEYLHANGINVSWNALTNAEKQYVRYAYMLNATKDIQGDFNDTQWQYANNMRVISQLVQTLKIQIGSILNAVLVPLAAILRVILQTITNLISSLGIVEKITNSIKGIFKSWGLDFDFGNSSMAAFGDDMANMLDDMEDNTAKTVKKIKRSLTSFDELHKLNDNSDSGSGLGKGIDLSSLMGALDAGYNGLNNYEPAFVKKIKEMLEKIKQAWLNADFTDIGKWIAKQLKSAFEWVNSKKEDIFSVFKNFGKSFATFLNGLFDDPTLFSEAAKTLLIGVESIIFTLDEFFKNLKGQKVGEGIAAFFSEIFKKDESGLTALDYFTTMLANGLNTISDILKGFANKIDTNEAGLAIANAVNNLFNSVNWSNVGSSIAQFANRIMTSLIIAIKNIDWYKVGQSVNDFLVSAFIPDENGNTILDAAADLISSFVNGITTALKEVLSGDGIQKVNQEIKDFFTTIRQQINWSDLSEVGIGLLNELNLIISEALSSIDWVSLIPLIATGLEILGDHIITTVSMFLVGTLASIVLAGLGSVADIALGILTNAFGIIKTLIELNILAFETVIKGVGDWWTSTVAPWFNNVKESISTLFNNIGTAITNKINSVKETITNFKNSVLNTMKSIWEGIKNIFGGIADWFKDIFEKAANGIKGAMDKVKNFFGFGETEVNVNAKQNASKVPHYAQGGYVRRSMPQLAVVGDNTSEGEIIAPESKIREQVEIALAETMDKYMNKFVELLSANAGNGRMCGDVYFDKDKVGRVFLESQNLTTARGVRK